MYTPEESFISCFYLLLFLSLFVDMDNARDVVVDSNYVFSTDPAYYRSGNPATGILVGAETWPVSSTYLFVKSLR